MKDKSSKILWITGLGFLALAILITFFPRMFTQLSWWPLEINAKSGQLGDTIGGTMGPFVALLAAALTFLAFWVQYRANQQIAKQFEHERFENKFYESLKVHKDNVAEINIDGKYQGRKSFVWMYKEYRFIYQLCSLMYEKILGERVLKGINIESFRYDERKLAELAYIIFFFGVGEISSKGVTYFTNDFDKTLIKKVIKELESLQSKYSKKITKKEWVKLKSKTFKKGVSILYVNFEPFDGHVAKLGHYFRHLYQLIKLASTDPVLSHENQDTEYDLRYDYVKQIRVQLSNHEQAMIYYNSFFKAGMVWWGDDTINKKNSQGFDVSYFLDFGMIKNVAYNLTDGIGPHPVKEFFKELLKRGYSIQTKEDQDNIKKRILELFEWEMSDGFFEKMVTE